MIERLTQSDFAIALTLAFGIASALALLFVAWLGVPAIERISGSTARRVLTNSAVPIAAQLVNRAVDLVFAAFMLRLLGVTGNGQYAVAVVVWLYVKTIADFGLGVLTTREAARYPDRAGRLLGATTLLRLIVLAALLPLVGAYAFASWQWSDLSRHSVAAIALLAVAVVPGSYTEAVNSVFNGRERMEFPAILNVLTNLCRAGIGLAVLLAGGGVVGLAGVAVVSTTASAIAFHLALRHLDVRPVWRVNTDEARQLLGAAWPLLLNALLVNLFFRADVFVVQASHGDQALGVYDAAYKFINMLLLIPAYFTLAVFPLLSRHAASDTNRLIDTYRLAAKLLFVVAWPITLATMVLAPFLITVLAGDAYLPGAAIALRILVWFLPFSYVNGITQYVLVAADRQRTITLAFVLAVVFNVAANLLLVPPFGYIAAAAVTVATELVIFAPLAIALRRYVGSVNWLAFASRPVAAAAAMGAAEVLGRKVGVAPAVVLGLVAYAIALVVFGAIGRREADIALEIIGRARPATS